MSKSINTFDLVSLSISFILPSAFAAGSFSIILFTLLLNFFVYGIHVESIARLCASPATATLRKKDFVCGKWEVRGGGIPKSGWLAMGKKENLLTMREG